MGSTRRVSSSALLRPTACHLVAIICLLACPSTGIELGSFLADNLVLARHPLSARLWGWGTPTESITVSLDGSRINNATAIVESDGTWSISLKPRGASAGPHTLTVIGSQSGSVTLKNVAFGDVFLCSGQSNMELAVAGAFNNDTEIADSINYPNLRLANVNLTTADTPQDRVGSKAPYVWATSAPDAFGKPWQWPSAACYFFGRDLYKMLGGRVPIGLVSAPWGGQTIETFSSPDAIADETCGGTVGYRHNESEGGIYHLDTDAVKIRLLSRTLQAMFRRHGRRLPETSQLWNAMIHPITNMRFHAALWYQGEANAADPISYACRFPAMIADWRRKFDLRLPFYFVQLAAYEQDYSLIREAQMAALQLPDVGYAVAIDIGDPSAPFGPIHPRRKQEVGRRLAKAVFGGPVYGRDVVTTGPVVRGAILQNKKSIVVTYVPGTAEHLHANGTAACDYCCHVSPFEILSSKTGNWTRVDFSISGNHRAVLAIPNGVTPTEVRYDWEGYPQCALYNGWGGPDDHTGIAASPFHVDIIEGY